MTRQKIQEGIVDWFRFEPTEKRSWLKMDELCKRLYNQYFPLEEPRYAKYHLLFPLLRLGIIEFYGSGTYALSPTCCIKGKKSLVWMNIPPHTLNPFQDLLPQLSIPTIRLTSDSNENIAFAKECRIPIITFNLTTGLRTIPGFECLFETWSDETVIDDSHFSMFIPGQSWQAPLSDSQEGLYKNGSEAFSSKLLKINAHHWKKVPSQQQNIDGFNMAATWSAIRKNSRLNVGFNSRCNLIEIRSPYFPIVVERLLALNTLTQPSYCQQIMGRKYYLQDSDFQILNRLFDNKIPIYE